jgi:hypothetical protein
MKNITVLIAARIRNPQETDWLKIALASIPMGVPIVLINDHSVVEWDEVERICKFKKKVLVVHLGTSTGLAAARNLALKHVKTDFFFPLDADDYLAENALQIAMDAYPGDGWLYGSTVIFNDKQRTTYKARPYDICKLLEAVYWPNGCLQKTENARKIGGWDESLILYEDWDYWLRSAKAGIIGHAIPDVLYYYRQNPNGIIQTLKCNPDMVKRAREAIETRHTDLFSGENPMACCGHKNTKTKMNTVPPPRNLTIPIPAANGMVLLTFLGGGMARSFYGASGICYRFGGSRRKFGYVAEEDVPGLMAMKENGKYLFVAEATK